MHAGLPPLCTVSWRSCIFLCTHDAQAKTLDPYDCKKFIVGKEVDNLLKTVSEKAQYMYDTALQNYKNFQVRTTTCYDMRQPGAPGHNAHPTAAPTLVCMLQISSCWRVWLQLDWWEEGRCKCCAEGMHLSLIHI